MEPRVAQEAKSESPIPHGLSNLEIAGHALLKTVCDYDPTRLVSLDVRFCSPVLVGETLRTEMRRDGDVVSLRTSTSGRVATVLTNGRAVVQRA